MIPKTLSASSLAVAEMCMSRWMTEYVEYTPNMGRSSAADVGTSFHGGAQYYVQAVYIDKIMAPDQDLLEMFYLKSYTETFGTTNVDTDEYRDGLALTRRWFKRTSFEGRTVLSVESKKRYPIPYNHPDGTVHEMPFTYIIDRLDQVGPTSYEVVDYKTVRAPIQPGELHDRIQARAYALFCQIEHPEATSVKVTFDLIRHEPISMYFTREDNAAFWRFLCAEVQRIINLTPEQARPVLNKECGYCVKKFTCPAMTKNVANGGIHSLSPDESVQLVADLQAQIKANESIVAELQEMIFIHAANTELTEWEANDNKVEITLGRRRKPDARRVADIIGPERFGEVGSITVKAVEAMAADPSLTDEQRAELSKMLNVYVNNDNLSLKVTPKKRIITPL